MNLIVGIDEAGRGCWAGPLVAAAVILDQPVEGLSDSKLLSPKKRLVLAKEIKAKALAYGIGWIGPKEIDEVGLTVATTRAMTAALSQIKATYSRIIIDGSYNYLTAYENVKTLVKADASIPEVSAASILAKTERDAYMRKISKTYPNYKFESHVGYGTRLHHQMLKIHGVCDQHRLSYKPLKLLLLAKHV